MIEPQKRLDYRQDVLTRFFGHVKSGDSFYIVGAPSVGKTRLMDFLMGDNQDVDIERDAVKKHYLGDMQAVRTWLIRVDLNRMRHERDWGFHFYELMLSAILFECSKYPDHKHISDIKNMLAGLDSQIIQSKDPLMAHRYFEMATNQLCQVYRLKLCFMFDEFDEEYKTMPREVFAQLRAVRDANKYRLLYILFLRNLPDTLRPPTENESFYELISRNIVGIGPYSRADTFMIIEDLEKRIDFPLQAEKRDRLVTASGGHPGLLNALFSVFRENQQNPGIVSNWGWYFSQEPVREEFRKIWIGLTRAEQTGLLAFSRGNLRDLEPQVKKILVSKGILIPEGGSLNYFTPLMPLFLETIT